MNGRDCNADPQSGHIGTVACGRIHAPARTLPGTPALQFAVNKLAFELIAIGLDQRTFTVAISSLEDSLVKFAVCRFGKARPFRQAIHELTVIAITIGGWGILGFGVKRFLSISKQWEWSVRQ
jgi:hypothetical protein